MAITKELNGAIYGIVSEEGVVKVGTSVVLVDRTTLEKITETKTDVNGGYAFLNLDPDSSDYAVFTMDNDGVSPKNALIKDYVTPVATEQGNRGANFPAAVASTQPVLAFAAQLSGTYANVHNFAGGGGWGEGWAWFYGGAAVNVSDASNPVPSAPLMRPMKFANTIGGMRPGSGVSWNYPKLVGEYALQGADTGFLKNEDYDRWAIYPRHRDNWPFSMLFIAKNEAANPITQSLSVIGNATLGNADWTGGSYNTDWATSISTTSPFDNNVSYWPRHQGFYVTLNAGTLKLQWIELDTTRKSVIIATGLVEGEWYQIIVRWSPSGAINGGDKFPRVTIVEASTGIKTEYVSSTLLTQVYYHIYSHGASASTSVRGWLGYFGNVNIAAGTLFSGDATLGFEKGAPGSGTSFATANGSIGPGAYWNRYLSDAEVALICSAYSDVASTKRLMPRFLSEIHARIPALYWPNDELPGQLSYTEKWGSRCKMLKGDLRRNGTLYSGRRRLMNEWLGCEAPRINSISCLGYANNTIMWSMRMSSTTRTNHLLYEYGMYTGSASAGANKSDLFKVYVNAGGKLTIAYTQTDNGVPYYTFNSFTFLPNTEYLTAITIDKSDDFRIRLYVNGVEVENQVCGSVPIARNKNYVSYDDKQSRFMSLRFLQGLDDEIIERHSSLESFDGCAGDFTIYHYKLQPADVTALYEAWALTVGPDSHT